jgi:hypothetical protein
MESPTTRAEENIFTVSVNRYLDEREKKWVKMSKLLTSWCWIFAVLFTLMFLTLAFVAKSFKELNDYERGYIEQKREQDAQLAKEYRQNMKDWKEDRGAEHGKTKMVHK